MSEEIKEAIKLFDREDLLNDYGIQDTDTNIEVFLSVKDMIKYYKQGKEIERLQKENNDLRKLYQRTYKHLFEIGNDELARYFQAQIDECPTFYVEPIVDYYEEIKRLNNIITELEKLLEEEQDRLARETSNIYEDSLGKTRLVNENIYGEVKKIKDKLQELRGDDKK